MHLSPRNNHALLRPNGHITILLLIKLDKPVTHLDRDLSETAVGVKQAENVFFPDSIMGEVSDKHAGARGEVFPAGGGDYFSFVG